MTFEALGEVSSSLLGALDAEQILQRLGRLVVPRFADQAIIDVVRADGTVRRRILADDPEVQDLIALLERTAPPQPHHATPAAAVLRGEGPQLLEDVDEALLVATTPGSADRRAAVRVLAPATVIAVPLPGRTGLLGCLTVLTTRASGRRLGPADVDVVVEVGERAGSALEAALLHERVVVTSERMAALQLFTAKLASARTAQEVADLAVGVGADVLGANTASLCLADEAAATMHLVAQRSMLAATVDTWRQFPLDAHLPACDAHRRRAPIVMRTLAARDALYPALARAEAVDDAFVVVPVLLDDEVSLGALTVGFAGHDTVLDDDVDDVLLAVGRQCALALERTRLAEAERRSAARQVFLGEAGRTLSSSLDLDRTLRELVGVLTPSLADSASVHLFDDGVLTLVAQAHVDPEGQAAMARLHERSLRSGPDPTMLEVAHTGTPILTPDVPPEVWPDLAEDEEHLADLLALRVRSGMVVAIRSRARTVGLLTLSRTSDRATFAPDDLELVVDLAGRAAVAIENALAHEHRDAQARALQDALLPLRLPDVPGLDLAVTFRPVGNGDIGGDLYDVFAVDHQGGQAWMIVVGDVCGKGAEAAAVTSLVRWTVRTAAKVDASPAAVLATCNQVLIDADLGDRFATVAVAVVHVDPDGVGAHAVVASGGHPLPVLRRLNGDAVPVGTSGPLLGIFREGTWPECVVDLAAGEALLVFTDGLQEARSPSGVFAPQLLEQVLRATVGAAASVTAQAVLRAVDTLERGFPRDDLAFLIVQVPPPDVDLVAVRVEGTPTAAAIQLDEHLAELLREIELVRIGDESGSSPYAQRVLTVLGGVLERFADARAAVRDQAELASFLGQASFTAELLLPPISLAAVEELRGLLVQVAGFAARGELLTLPPTEGAIGPTSSWFGEISRQLAEGGPSDAYVPLAVERPLDRLEPGAVPVGSGPALVVHRHAALHIELRTDMARVARRFVGEVLSTWGDPRADVAALPVTELVTNAQIHARTPVDVVVMDAGRILRIEVQDGSPDLPVIRSRDRTAGTGRGLALVDALAVRWGIAPTAAGKVAWMDLVAPARTGGVG